MFPPATRDEMKVLGWDECDVVIVSGDAYIDSPFSGAAVIANLLNANGFRTGIITQPVPEDRAGILRLGIPRLWWGVTGGMLDSMVANYTALGKRRNRDDCTPGGINDRRPDRAVIVYANMIRNASAGSAKSPPIVLGGVEASLRRVLHYDFREDRLRRSILIDSAADYLVYGMGETAVLALSRALSSRAVRDTLTSIPGIAYVEHKASCERESDTRLPSWEDCLRNPDMFARHFELFYRHSGQKGGSRLLEAYPHGKTVVVNPPSPPLTTEELDAVHELHYDGGVHPFDLARGAVRAFDTVRDSLVTHRGCFGECAFCAIAVHQGKGIVSRSKESLEREIARIESKPGFTGVIQDLGGPTANMLFARCKRHGMTSCRERKCLIPDRCPNMEIDHKAQRELLSALSKRPKIRVLRIQSGIRHDLVLADGDDGREYLRLLASKHAGGTLKVAFEHADEAVLALMGKPRAETAEKFLALWKEIGVQCRLATYLMVCYPGSGVQQDRKLRRFLEANPSLIADSVQVFTPTPLTLASVLYYTKKESSTGKAISVITDQKEKEKEKNLVRDGLEFEKPGEKRTKGKGNTASGKRIRSRR